MVTIRNLLLYLGVIFLMIVAILQCRAAWGCEYYIGGITGHLPDDSTIQYSGVLNSFTADGYGATLVIDGVVYHFPLGAILWLDLDNRTCVFEGQFDADPIFITDSRIKFMIAFICIVKWICRVLATIELCGAPLACYQGFWPQGIYIGFLGLAMIAFSFLFSMYQKDFEELI